MTREERLYEGFSCRSGWSDNMSLGDCLDYVLVGRPPTVSGMIIGRDPELSRRRQAECKHACTHSILLLNADMIYPVLSRFYLGDFHDMTDYDLEL